MPGGLLKNIWVPLSGQIAQQRKVETIANNIANANTTGFKKDDVTFKEHLTALSGKNNDINLPRNEWTPDDFYHTDGAENAFVKVTGSYTDFSQGNLNPTGRPFDFALHGKGFFEVLTPQGVRYTRNGNFNLSKEGHMVTTNGHKLLSSGDGDPQSRIIAIDPKFKISVSKEGEIFNQNGNIGNLKLVEFKDPHSLRKHGDGLFRNDHQDN